MNKTAIITGASRGIGAALAYAFAQAGYHLSLCCCHSSSDLEQLAAKLQTEFHTEVLTFAGDVGDHDFVHEMVNATISHFGHVDVLINNAGIAHIGLLSDMTIGEWDHIIACNLTSVFSYCKYVIPQMVSRQNGKIINISSVWGNVGASCEVAYSACKGGINSFTKALGKELAPSNVQVNAIACGVIDTQMNACFDESERTALAEEIPAGRFGSAEEVAHLALQLATGNEYLTGQIITLDGGWI